MTTSESNRATVLRFAERLSARDFAGMAELVTPDATWWVVGRTDYAPYAGLHRVSDVLQLLIGFVGALDEFTFTAENSIAEGDRVAIEATSLGKMGEAEYANVYMMRYELRDGKIHSIREFFDGFAITAYLDQMGISSSEAFAGIGGAS